MRVLLLVSLLVWQVSAPQQLHIVGRSMAVTRTYNATVESDPASVSVIGMTAGRLIVVTVMERSGAAATSHVVSNGGTSITFTRRVAITAAQSDGTFRRSASVWTGTVPGDANVGIISADDGTTNTKRITIEEFDTITEAEFATAIGAENGTTANADTLASGSTPDSVSGDLFLWAGLFIKNTATVREATAATWSNGPDDANALQVNGGSNGRQVRTTFGEVSGASAGTRSTTAQVTSWSAAGANNNGLMVALLVFGTIDGGGGATPIPVFLHSYRMRRANY